MRILIAYGSKGKFFHMSEFVDALSRLGMKCKIVKDIDFSKGFPSKKIKDWFPNKKFKELISDFKPDIVFVDRPTHFGLDAIKAEIPLFFLLRGHYWSEVEYAKKTIHSGPKDRFALMLRNRNAEKIHSKATAIFTICNYLIDIVKEYHPNQKIHVFFEGIDKEKWYRVKGSELKHPCVGLLQDANWWGKTKEMLILKKILKDLPNVNFYWAGDGPYREKILNELKEFKNFKWLGRLSYPEKVREYLSDIDVYALITGMDLAPLTLKEAQLMEKPVLATEIGGISEMMIEGKTGFLIKEGDAETWVKKINVLLNDKKLSDRMGKEGREFVSENFNWDLIAKKFLENIKQDIN